MASCACVDQSLSISTPPTPDIEDNGEHTEMLESLTSIPLPPQQKRIIPLRSPQSQLIQSNYLPTRLLNSLPRTLRNPQCCHTHLGDIEHPHIIRHSPYNHNGLSLRLLIVGELAGDEADAHGGTVSAGLEEPFEDGFVEL